MKGNMRTLIAVTVVALVMAGGAAADVLVTSSQVRDESLTAADLGPDITKVKAVSVSIHPSQDVTDPECEVDCPVLIAGIGDQSFTVRCASGNVTGGGVRGLSETDAVVIQESYPASDSSWRFVMWSGEATSEPVELRVVCI